MLTLSEICRNLNFCNLCRDKIGGSGFRLAMIKVHGYSSDVTDFDCWHGKPWRDGKNIDLNLNSLFPVSQSVNEPAVTPEIVELSKQRFEICKICDQSSENGHKCSLHKGCCFGRWRAQPENKCPADPPKWNTLSKAEKLKTVSNKTEARINHVQNEPAAVISSAALSDDPGK